VSRLISELAFFQPLDFHLQPADLFVELFFVRLLLRTPTAAVLKESHGPFQKRLLPGRDLAGMDPELGRQLGRRLLPLARRHRDLRLKRRPKTTSLPRHPNLLQGFRQRGFCTLPGRTVFGVRVICRRQVFEFFQAIRA
jgi:hypothetical protein